MTENALSILIVIFSVQLQQTEISERKLFIFHLGGSPVGTFLQQLTVQGMVYPQPHPPAAYNCCVSVFQACNARIVK